MPKVLTASDSLTCTVGKGTVQTSGASKLIVNGNPVLTVKEVEGKSVLGCVPPGSPPPPPCSKAGSILSGASQKLIIVSSPALLDQTTAKGDPQPHPIGPASASQSKLVAL